MARAALWFWIFAWMTAGNKLDFAFWYESELDESNAADVLSGMVYVYVNMDTRFISDMGRVAAGVMMDICPFSRAIANSYQDITTMAKIVYTLNIQFHVLTKEPANCQQLFRLAISEGSIARLLELQMGRDATLDEVDVAALREVNEFSAHLNLPTVGLRSIVYLKAMGPLPTATATKTLSTVEGYGQNITDELLRDVDAGLVNVAGCTLVNSGCVCTSLIPKCSWGTTGGASALCVDSKNVPSGFQAVTDECTACPSTSCSNGVESQCPGYFTPCSCANSKYDCAWNRTLGSCEQKGISGATSCQLCAKQAGCSPPVTNSFLPMHFFAISQMNATFNTDVRLTGRGNVAFQCEGDLFPRQVPDSGLRIFQGKTLMINAKTVPNEKQRRCELLIDEGALASSANISFLGLPCTQMCGEKTSYGFVLQDNLGPQVISTIPQSGALGVKDTILQITFDEELQYGKAFVALLKKEETGELVAEFRQGPKVTLEQTKISIDIAGAYEHGKPYSLELPRESLFDQAGNMLQKALVNNAFTFTFAHVEQKVAFVEEEEVLSPEILGVIVGGVVLLVCGIGAVFVYWSRHMAPVREFIGRRFSRVSRVSRVTTWNGARQSAFQFRLSGAFNLARGNTMLEVDKPRKAWEHKEPKEVKPWDMSPKQLELEIRKQRHERKNQEKREERREEEREIAEMKARQAERSGG